MSSPLILVRQLEEHGILIGFLTRQPPICSRTKDTFTVPAICHFQRRWHIFGRRGRYGMANLDTSTRLTSHIYPKSITLPSSHSPSKSSVRIANIVNILPPHIWLELARHGPFKSLWPNAISVYERCVVLHHVDGWHNHEGVSIPDKDESSCVLDLLRVVPNGWKPI